MDLSRSQYLCASERKRAGERERDPSNAALRQEGEANYPLLKFENITFQRGMSEIELPRGPLIE
jgi:hypothetical protein